MDKRYKITGEQRSLGYKRPVEAGNKTKFVTVVNRFDHCYDLSFPASYQRGNRTRYAVRFLKNQDLRVLISVEIFRRLINGGYFKVSIFKHHL